MLGLFGPKKPGELAFKSATGGTPPPKGADDKTAKDEKYSGSGFDPTGLERAAKAAREIDASQHATLAFEVIQQQELTKQLEHQTRQAAYEAQARQYEMGRVKEEAEEARRTLDAQTEHAKRQAKYSDDLERQRYAAQIQAQREVREAELRRQEDAARRQEELRRKTIAYEAELREKTELARAKAEAEAAAKADRENHDLSLERMRVEMKERRETLLASIKLGLSTVGDGAKTFLGDSKQMAAAVGLASAVALGIYGARGAANVAAKYVEARLGKPSLVRDTSRAAPLSSLRAPVTTARKAIASLITTQSSSDHGAASLEGVVLAPELESRLRGVARATANTKANGAPFRHVLLHGPPGTGKTLFATKLALASGLDYAIMTGGDVAPLGRDAVTEIHKLFDWAKASSKGLLLFIDEADAFLRKRATEAMSEDLRNAFNAFLHRTGDQSTDFMLVYATNRPTDFDWAVNDRVDEIVKFELPTPPERKRLLQLYLDKYVGGGLLSDDAAHQKTIEIADPGNEITTTLLDRAVEATAGFSGREIAKLCIAWQAAAYATEGAVFTPMTMRQVLDNHVEQRGLKATWMTDDERRAADTMGGVVSAPEPGSSS